jgi:hypothetical protein
MKIMKRGVSIGILLLLFNLPAVSSAGVFPEIKGWTPEGEANIKTPDDLWEYINGAAGLYLSYGFKVLRYCDFTRGDHLMTVDIYDMGSPLNAFGIYATERPGDVKPRSIGTEAVIIPPAYCLLLKDRFYIKVQMIKGDIDDDSLKTVLNSIDTSIKGSSSLPAELSLLPKQGRITRSESYVKEAYLGLDELNNVIFAGYTNPDGEKFRYFLVLPSQGETPSSVWEKLAGRWNATTLKGRPVLHRDIPYEGKIGIIQKENKLFGVSGISDADEMFKRLDEAF